MTKLEDDFSSTNLDYKVAGGSKAKVTELTGMPEEDIGWVTVPDPYLKDVRVEFMNEHKLLDLDIWITYEDKRPKKQNYVIRSFAPDDHHRTRWFTNMTTIPARLATISRSSSSPTESRNRVLKLFRDWYRSAPEIVNLYALNTPPSYIRYCMRQKFEANRHVTNQKAIDILVLKGRQEYQETMNGWKTIDHVCGILLDSNTKGVGRSGKSFLVRFYEGRDERAVLPAASGVV